MISTGVENGAPVGDLVTAASKGDEVAWATLIRRLSPRLRSIARGYRLCESDVDDVVQECWIRLSVHLADLREPGAVHGWLATTARRQALQVIRERRSTYDLDSLADRADGAASPADVVTQHDTDTRLRRAMSRLPRRDERLLSALSTSNRPSYARVASLLGLPIGSIGPTRARALQRLRHELQLQGLTA